MNVRETLEEAVTDLELDGQEIRSENLEPIEVEQAVEEEQVEAPKEEISSEESEAPSVEENGAEQDMEEIPVPVVAPPSGWRADEKQLFAKLPPELQHEVARRESDRDRLLHQSRQKYGEVDKVYSPHEAEFQKQGVSLANFVERAIGWDKAFRERPYDAIREMCELTGVNLTELARLVESAQPQDPYVRQLMEQNKALEQKFQAIESEKEQGRRQAQEGHYLSLVQEVQAFQSAKDQAGNALFPYAQTLEKDMALLVPRVQEDYPEATTSQILAEAYTRAMRANPLTYSQYERNLLASKQASSAQAIQKKKVAASSISGSPSGSKTTTNATSVRDILKETGAELGIF